MKEKRLQHAVSFGPSHGGQPRHVVQTFRGSFLEGPPSRGERASSICD